MVISMLVKTATGTEGESAESVYKDSYDIFEQMYHQWEEKVAYEVNTFVFKK